MLNKKQLLLLSTLFFISGMSGLTYQVAWQRVLYAAFGSDVDSVAIIVSAFMLGLGLGALGGGKIVDKYPNKALQLFCFSEFGIGLFGLISYQLILFVGDIFIVYNLIVVAIINFLLVLIPALLMGATLPILITYIAQFWKNIGQTTGHLYAINTLGATLGAGLTGFILFNHFGLHGVTILAALGNFIVATFAFLFFNKTKVKNGIEEAE
ncbi:MFS transporter [Gilliamella sp. Pra-s65]|uniref:MFS transporter n=1 Tax=unclassified Gilliamella TaxID=2685620 RepID=UPI001365FD41|nr:MULTISPECIES: MFS transporter [unclassified Gilliamella]MWN90353.1 MFS transporter [Gilliamella sp. Pra-s65]MWP73375.1 MFS transporter [Gilliamella sp. Pra-s52]